MNKKENKSTKRLSCALVMPFGSQCLSTSFSAMEQYTLELPLPTHPELYVSTRENLPHDFPPPLSPANPYEDYINGMV